MTSDQVSLSNAAIADGSTEGGPIAALPKPERFHWLVSPRSTMIQTSPVHVGRGNNGERALDDLLNEWASSHRTGQRAYEGQQR